MMAGCGEQTQTLRSPGPSHEICEESAHFLVLEDNLPLISVMVAAQLAGIYRQQMALNTIIKFS